MTNQDYHTNLRNKYSQILRKNIFSNDNLSDLSEEEKLLLFQELSKWFGTSPPETNRVKADLKNILRKNIDFDNVQIEEDNG